MGGSEAGYSAGNAEGEYAPPEEAPPEPDFGDDAANVDGDFFGEKPKPKNIDDEIF